MPPKVPTLAVWPKPVDLTVDLPKPTAKAQVKVRGMPIQPTVAGVLMVAVAQKAMPVTASPMVLPTFPTICLVVLVPVVVTGTQVVPVGVLSNYLLMGTVCSPLAEASKPMVEMPPKIMTELAVVVPGVQSVLRVAQLWHQVPSKPKVEAVSLIPPVVVAASLSKPTAT